MRAIALTLIALTAVAHADTSVAVVVSGTGSIKTQTLDVVDNWFEAHGLTATKSPLPKDGVKTLENCLVLSDMSCARGVVEARGKADNIIGITELVSGKGENRTVQLAAYWIAKRRQVVSLQRTCDACTDAVFKDMLVAMLDDLAKLAPTMGGKIHVTSVPAGLSATVDNDAAAVTPFDRDVSFGPHVVSIMRDGRVVASKKIEVTPEAMIDVPITAPVEKPAVKQINIVEQHRSRVAPVMLLTVGLAASVTGVVLYRYGGPTGESYMYRNMRPAGIATAISGGVAAIVGTVWLVKGGSTSSRPEVSMTPTTATVGWARSF